MAEHQDAALKLLRAVAVKTDSQKIAAAQVHAELEVADATREQTRVMQFLWNVPAPKGGVEHVAGEVVG
jgi:hypothetical protein